MTVSFARYLPDFEITGMNGFHADQRIHDDVKLAALPDLNLDSIRAEARAEGEASAKAELERQFEAEHLAIESLHAAELQALRAELEASAAQTIPAAIEARSAAIADLIATDVEAVLAPLVNAAIRKRILSGLSDEIRKILALETSNQIRVSGPEGLVAALRDHIGGDVERMTVQETDGFDIEVEFNRTLFASRLADWSKALAEVLE